jgi:uridine phosphorylase
LEEKDILINKPFLDEPSQFKPENLLREARRQRNIQDCPVPKVCMLDPDGDIVDYLLRSRKVQLNSCWSCYHTKMYEFNNQGLQTGIIGCAVGSSYAVLLAEQLFVSGCELLISITSAGIINQPKRPDTQFLLISEALRDEGTSYHYLPPGQKSCLNSGLFKKIAALTTMNELKLEHGKSWTTDAPYRETATAIAKANAYGAVSVEMEAAALYAFAEVRDKSVICYAHLTNTMAQEGDDFEKGAENGSLASLNLVAETVKVALV